VTDPVLSVSTSNGRFYKDPQSSKQVPSITNVIGMKDKPALKYWSSKMCATFAAQNLDVLNKLDEKARIDLIKGAPFRSTGDSAQIGNTVHDYIDGYAKHYITTKKATGTGDRSWEPEGLDDAAITTKRMWNQFKYCDQHYNIDWLVSEFTVWSERYDYAGTGDWIARIGKHVVYGDTKCMVPETLITMANGTEKRVDEVRCGEYVVAWDGEGFTNSRVVTCGENGVKPVVRITTLQGRKLTVTHDHPMFTDAGEIKAADLKVNDLLRIGSATPKDSASMSADDAYLVGLVLGDGGLSHNNQVRMTTMDPLIVEFLESYAHARGMKLSVERQKYRAKDRDSKASGYTIIDAKSKPYRNPVSQMFRDMGLMGAKSGDKFVPDAVMMAGREAWLNFLAGYLDTDGHVQAKPGRSGKVTSYALRWISKSERLPRQCQSMLAGLGIRSSVKPVKVKWHGVYRDYWQLNISSRAAVLRFQDLIPRRGARTIKLLDMNIPPVKYPKYAHTEPEGFDVVKTIEPADPAFTIYIEIAGTHTHVTNGLVTGNTGNGVYPEVAMQVAAGAAADYAIDGDGNHYELPKAEKFAVLHVRPTFTRLYPLNGIPAAFKAFLGLRTVFEWQCTESEKVIVDTPKIQGPR
jgi:hypothetical protein